MSRERGLRRSTAQIHQEGEHQTRPRHYCGMCQILAFLPLDTPGLIAGATDAQLVARQELYYEPRVFISPEQGRELLAICDEIVRRRTRGAE